MSKVLFLYNDLNNAMGISTVMGVAERYARKSDNGVFKVSTGSKPTINFDNGASIHVRPATKGLGGLAEFDKIYVDESLDMIVDSSRFNQNVELYNKDSFLQEGRG